MSAESNVTEESKRANTERVYHVTPEDLPVSCPMPDMALWDAHPKVYLPVEKTGHAICPYCSAEFILAGE